MSDIGSDTEAPKNVSITFTFFIISNRDIRNILYIILYYRI